MHAHERTLLNQLGFADADKKDRRHDLACQFLAITENAAVIAKMFVPRRKSIDRCSDPHPVAYGHWEHTGQTVYEFDKINGVDSERALNKGAGQYKTTVGFIDTVIRYQIKATSQSRVRNREYEEQPWGEWSDTKTEIQSLPNKVAIEVKIARVGVGDILRQINLYREFILESADDEHRFKTHWALAAAFDLTDHESEQLAKAQIKFIRLGAKFDAFVQQQNSEDAGKGKPSLEF